MSVSTHLLIAKYLRAWAEMKDIMAAKHAQSFPNAL